MSKNRKRKPPSRTINGIDAVSYSDRYAQYSQMNPDGFRKLPKPKSNKSIFRPKKYATDLLLARAVLLTP